MPKLPASHARHPAVWAVALALVYGAGSLAWYGSTPLGAFPVLDGREMLELARAMASGTLPPEPFYRAPLYPALLAVPLALGVPDIAMPHLARLLNLCAHLLSSALVCSLALRIWGDRRAALVSGALYALYPVAVHYASDPYDIALATTLALASTWAALRALEAQASARWAVAAGALGMAATLTRPHFAPCVIALCAWLTWQAKCGVTPWKQPAWCLLGVLCVAGSMGMINLQVGAEFRVLPWQGSHALWDANGPGANGRYYTHTIPNPGLRQGVNPARAEAELLYCQAQGCAGERIDRGEFARYWRTRLIAYARSQPWTLLGLQAEKFWYLLNHYEQYNNKTYWVHKQRSPWLRHNPLGWAPLLAGALAALWLHAASRPARGFVLWLAAAYAAGVLLYFVSARFRVPLAAFLCVLVGGLVLLSAQAARLGRARILALSGTGLLVGTLAFWPVPAALRESTLVDDYTLLASAALQAGHTDEGEAQAMQVLARRPDRAVAHALVCAARLQRWDMAPTDAIPPSHWLESSLGHCKAGASGSDQAGYNAGLLLAALCRKSEAVATWHALSTSGSVADWARSALADQEQAAPATPAVVSGPVELRAMDPARLTPGQRSQLAALRTGRCDSAPPAPAGS